jgi:hypothetical protein
MKNVTATICLTIAVLLGSAGIFQNPVSAQVSESDFLNMVFSQATFLEQCVSRRIIPNTDIHNWNLNKVKSAGASTMEYWSAMQKGADGRVYDLLRGKWVRVKINLKNCELVLREQKKLKKSLSRH